MQRERHSKKRLKEIKEPVFEEYYTSSSITPASNKAKLFDFETMSFASKPFSGKANKKETRKKSIAALPKRFRLPERNVDVLEYDPVDLQAAAVENNGNNPFGAGCCPEIEIIGSVVAAPGSTGGLGPGIPHGVVKDFGKLLPSPHSSIYGGIYVRLGLELATGHLFDWKYVQKESAVACKLSKTTKTQPVQSGSTKKVVAFLQLDWSFQIKGRLRKQSTLCDGIQDILAAVDYMYSKYCKPVIVLGFSFGGPTMLASLRKKADIIAGFISFAGSARGGPLFAKSEHDSEGAVQYFSGKSLFLHGTHDHLVALPISEYLHSLRAPTGLSTLMIVQKSDHYFDVARNLVYPVAKDFITQTLLEYPDDLVPMKDRKDKKDTLVSSPCEASSSTKLSTRVFLLSREIQLQQKEDPCPKKLSKRELQRLPRGKESGSRTRKWWGGGSSPKKPTKRTEISSPLCGWVGYNE